MGTVAWGPAGFKFFGAVTIGARVALLVPAGSM